MRRTGQSVSLARSFRLRADRLHGHRLELHAQHICQCDRAGLVLDAKRAIWQMDQVEVYDGGPDGDADTAPPATRCSRCRASSFP